LLYKLGTNKSLGRDAGPSNVPFADCEIEVFSIKLYGSVSW